MSDAIRTYRDFWPFYLGEHAKPATRLWHIVGTSIATVTFTVGVLSASPGLMLAAIVVGYLPAWAAHFAIERNKPATFRYPVWSLISDFRMAGLWFAGALENELTKAGIPRGRGGRD